MERKKMRNILIVGSILIIIFAISQHLDWFGGLFLKTIGILTPFLVGGLLALFLNVPMNFFENKVFKFLDRVKFGHKLKRPLAVLIVFYLITSPIAGPTSMPF